MPLFTAPFRSRRAAVSNEATPAPTAVPRGLIDLPRFEPHPLLRGGHAQTLFAFVFAGERFSFETAHRHVKLDDGDTVVLHDSCPPGWQPGSPVAVLVHGLAGCANSSYMVRIAAKLYRRGVRAFRMDQRNCGAGLNLALHGYHAGRSDDVRTVVEFVDRFTGGSPMSLVGFSLGGNMVLKMLGEEPERVPSSLVRGMAVNPAADLAACAGTFESGMGRLYDRHFVSLLHAHVQRCPGLYERDRLTNATRPIRRVIEFDDYYTAPVNGFEGVGSYYERTSAAQFVPRIAVPTLILASADDPVVPVRTMEALDRPDNVLLHIAPSGGHLGFISRGSSDPDRRWMDWRVVDWASEAALAESIELAA